MARIKINPEQYKRLIIENEDRAFDFFEKYWNKQGGYTHLENGIEESTREYIQDLSENFGLDGEVVFDNFCKYVIKYSEEFKNKPMSELYEWFDLEDMVMIKEKKIFTFLRSLGVNVETDVFDRIGSLTKKGDRYLYTADNEDLASLWAKGSGREIAENVLSEDYWEPYYDVVHDWFNQCWDELTEKTVKFVKKELIKKLKGQTIDVTCMDDYEEHFPDGTMVVNVKNMSKISDRELGYLIKDCDDLEQFKTVLDSIYTDTYNNVASADYYDAIMGPIEDFLGKPIEHGSYQRTQYDKQGKPYKVFISTQVYDITDILETTVLDYLECCGNDITEGFWYMLTEKRYNNDEEFSKDFDYWQPSMNSFTKEYNQAVMERLEDQLEY